jgi:CMP-N,N'-diacetyllegionaminic acid synthase
VRILALVPARGGSKRVPGKNIRPLHGKPLLVWSIEAARDVPSVCDIMVSTDAQEIADVARDAGALVPWLRPGELATDTATSVEVALHALSWYEEDLGPVDGLLLLQPTSPFRTKPSIARAISLFREQGQRTVVSVSPAADHPLWCYRIDDHTMRPFIDRAARPVRSQDLPPAYALNGSIYLIAPKDLRAKRSFLPEDAVPLVIESTDETLDIDTEADWRAAMQLPRPGP